MPYISYSAYPEALDGYATMPLRVDGVHEIVAADHNRLRDAIIKIEQELGVNPSGTYATVADRLDAIGDAHTLITAHLVDPIDAHDASAISFLDAGDNYTSDNVEDAIVELAAVLPVPLDVIGANNVDIPNSGTPDFVGKSGKTFGFVTSSVDGLSNDLISATSATIMDRTQPVGITGIHIIDIGDANGFGTAYLRMSTLGRVKWMAPGDAFGAEVDVTSMSEGDVVTLTSSTTTKRIRIARTSASLPSITPLPITDTFDIMRLDASTGAFSVNSIGIMSSNYITRTASTSTGISRSQFVISGMVYPADRGTLVVQRKPRGSSAFYPIAVLDLTENFDEDLRATGQPAYSPSLSNFDTISLYDRLPAEKEYTTVDASGSAVYEDFDLAVDFIGYQLAKYFVPISNTDIVGGELEAPTNISLTEINDKVSAYRIVHYKTGITDFNGNPSSTDIFNIYDIYGSSDDDDSTVRFSNVFVDTNTTRPTVTHVILRPDIPSTEVLPKFLSGINYYNSADDKFDLEIKTGADLFKNAYLEDDILTFDTDAFYFTSGDGYGDYVNVTQLMDDGYVLYSDSNLPIYTDFAYYMINDSINPSRKLYPDVDKFSTNARVSVTAHDPFGDSDVFNAYGFVSSSEIDVRILVNSFDRYRATETQEWFTDESMRVGTDETFDFDLERDQFVHTYMSGDGYSLDPWDNTIALSTGGTDVYGELQCGGRFTANQNVPGLIFPQSDYSSGIAPAQDNAPDYSSSSYYSGVDELIYQRLFNLGHTINGARLRVVSGGSSLVSFNDIYSGNSSRFGKIEVKIPGTGSNSTGWMDIGKLFSTGEYEDGAGALSGSVTGTTGDFTVPFTFGSRSNANTAGMVAVRVTYFGGAKAATAKTKILTMLELLESDL